MSLANLHDLMLHELKDIYNAERQLVTALPRVAKRASSEPLHRALMDHLSQTENHVARLEQVFDMLGETAKARKCEGMQGIIDEAKGLLEEEAEPDVLDAGIIGAAQKVEHYEIAAYGTVCAYARRMGHDEVADVLEETLQEEKEADRLLTELAEDGINQQAEHEGEPGETTGTARRARNGGGNGPTREGGGAKARRRSTRAHKPSGRGSAAKRA